MLIRNGILNNVQHMLVSKLVLKHIIKKAGKVAMHSFVAGDKFIGCAEAGHQSAFLKPENRAERTAEKDSFYGRKGNQALGKRAVINPTQCPFGFLLHAGNSFNSIKKVAAFVGIF